MLTLPSDTMLVILTGAIILGRAQTHLAKLLLAKVLLLKHAQTCFLLLKIRLADTNLAKSKSTFEHVLARATSRMLSAETCQNVLESIFGFCSIDVRQSYLLRKLKSFVTMNYLKYAYYAFFTVYFTMA